GDATREVVGLGATHCYGAVPTDDLGRCHGGKQVQAGGRHGARRRRESAGRGQAQPDTSPGWAADLLENGNGRRKEQAAGEKNRKGKPLQLPVKHGTVPLSKNGRAGNFFSTTWTASSPSSYSCGCGFGSAMQRA